VKIVNHPSIVNLDAFLKKYDDKNSSMRSSSTVDENSRENVQLSFQAKEIARIQRVLETTQNLRAKEVDKIRQRIEEGSYRVRSEAVAEKMIRENLVSLIIW
jgi:flagellar biosynthesis anti-sigma factor FlgM